MRVKADDRTRLLQEFRKAIAFLTFPGIRKLECQVSDLFVNSPILATGLGMSLGVPDPRWCGITGEIFEAPQGGRTGQCKVLR
ncbi:hypothetical protein D3C86_1826600 [compost metagenome]